MPSADSNKQIKDAAERLRASQKNGELDQAKSAAKELIKKLPAGVTEAARAAAQSPETRAQVIEAAKSAAGNVIPQMSGNPADAAAAGAVPAQETPPPAASGPVPGTLPLIEGASSPTAGVPMGVIEADRTDFDLKQGIFLYSGHVRARHPDFYIECEELEVHMIKDEPSVKKQAKPAPGPSKKEDTGDKAPPIRKAIARGPMVIIEKRDPQGDVQQGRCKRLDYDGLTGEMTLSDFPQVQKGNVMHIATTSDTVMVFDKNGKLSTNRPSRTVILGNDQPGQQGAGQVTN